jgi:predicted nucleic acid-binding protein
LIDEKQVVFWKEKYAKKARTEREKNIKKALKALMLMLVKMIAFQQQLHNYKTAYSL